MKKVYSHENGFISANIKNILEAENIKTVVKNEYASSAIGEISALDAWVEIWVLHDKDYDKAHHIINQRFSQIGDQEWTCNNCQEMNDASFQVCWQCTNEKPS